MGLHVRERRLAIHHFVRPLQSGFAHRSDGAFIRAGQAHRVGGVDNAQPPGIVRNRVAPPR